MWLSETLDEPTGRLTTMSRSMREKTQRALKEATRQVPAVIRSEVRRRYTYKGALSIRRSGGGLMRNVTVRGSRQTIKHFKTRAPTKRRHLYAEVVRGQGGTIRSGFKYNGTYFMRLTATRYPIKAIYAPSTAEMAGHESDPATAINRQIEAFLAARMSEISI